jgi:glycosyltransferase involved in cell wall biosynthesis
LDCTFLLCCDVANKASRNDPKMVDRGHPLISVVIPTYNRPDYLRLALASVIAQTYRHLEIIIQDNASPQDIAGLVADFGDDRIRLHRNDRNIGQTPNILAAVAGATGTYVAILGDDDIWKPGFVAALLAPMEANADVVVAFCDHDIIDSDGRLQAARTEQITRRFARHRIREGMHCPFAEIALVYRSICIVSGALIRRDAIDWSQVPADLPLSSDIYIAYLLARTGRGCWYIAERLMQYRYHAAQLSSTDTSRLEQARWSLDFWTIFLRDEKLGNKTYFKMVCARRAALVILDRLTRQEWRELSGDLSNFSKRGLLDPRVVYYHLFYFIRFRWEGLRRLVP